MTFPDYFSDASDEYRAVRPSYPDELVDFIADAAPDRELVWDAGCGSGQLSVPLARRFQTVIATDASAEQLARARTHPRVRYALRPSEIPPDRHRQFSAVAAAQAAHWFDFRGFYDAVRRSSERDALVALTSYGLFSVDPEVDRLVADFYRETLHPFWPPERRHVETGYADLPFPFAEITTPPLAMNAVWESTRLLRYIGTWSAVRRLVAQSSVMELETFGERLLKVWPAGEERLVRWPLSVRAGYLRSASLPDGADC